MDAFYLGTHMPQHLASAGVPLFVSHRRLVGRKTLPRAAAEYAIDSGAYTELLLHGEWRVSPKTYVADIKRFDSEIGRMAWCAPQDWACESTVLAATGLSVEEHQRRTVANFIELQMIWGDERDCPVMPVLQGFDQSSYLRCMDLYAKAGIDLKDYPLVGVGSVCRREATAEIDGVISALLRQDPGLPLHTFGAAGGGIARYGHKIASADSLSWSYAARRRRPLPGHTHSSCSNCLEYALLWRERVLAKAPGWQLRRLYTAA